MDCVLDWQPVEEAEDRSNVFEVMGRASCSSEEVVGVRPQIDLFHCREHYSSVRRGGLKYELFFKINRRKNSRN